MKSSMVQLLEKNYDIVMEAAEVDDVGDAVNLDDKGSCTVFASGHRSCCDGCG